MACTQYSSDNSLEKLTEEQIKKYREVFPSELLSCASMAHKVNNLIEQADPNDKFLVVCDNSHMSFGNGVPERIWKKNPDI